VTRPAWPRIMFVFHSAHPSGGNLWLQKLLLNGPFRPEQCIAVLPGESSLAAELVEAGIECHTLALIEQALNEAHGKKRLELAQSKIRYFSEFRALVQMHRPDVVYVNSGVQILPGLAAAREKIPIVWHIKEGWGSGTAFAIKRTAVRRCADAMLFDSAAGLRLYEPIPKGKSATVVPNGVSEELATRREQRESLRARYGWSADQFTLLFVGSIVQRKGVHDLLQVWEELSPLFPSARLMIVGPKDANELHPRLTNFENQLPPSTTFLGFRKDAQDLMAAADLFVLPSYGEAMPISISEAMMIGCPVVARNVADVPFQIGEGRGFLFRGDGPEPLRAALREALESQAERDLRAESARAFAREHLTWTAHCELIKSVVDQTARRGKSVS